MLIPPQVNPLLIILPASNHQTSVPVLYPSNRPHLTLCNAYNRIRTQKVRAPPSRPLNQADFLENWRPGCALWRIHTAVGILVCCGMYDVLCMMRSVYWTLCAILYTNPLIHSTTFRSVQRQEVVAIYVSSASAYLSVAQARSDASGQSALLGAGAARHAQNGMCRVFVVGRHAQSAWKPTAVAHAEDVYPCCCADWRGIGEGEMLYVTASTGRARWNFMGFCVGRMALYC